MQLTAAAIAPIALALVFNQCSVHELTVPQIMAAFAVISGFIVIGLDSSSEKKPCKRGEPAGFFQGAQCRKRETKNHGSAMCGFSSDFS